MSIWTFKSYIEESGKDVIGHWLKGLPASGRVRIRSGLKYLSITDEWECGPSKDYRKLKRVKCPLHELLLTDKIGKKQYRIFGYFVPGEKVFVMLIGTDHKDDIYNPPSCFDTAEKRYKLAIERGSIHNYEP